ncbi:MAG: hypothetical protein D6B27_11225 [Gammaproteobacteria bacterium]|nr:MAG: hypothetical protein D6B27_11225 [Gammaproteobacteria bacterium]
MKFKTATKAIGVFIVAISCLGGFSWINRIDPDCHYYTTKNVLQGRLCDEPYTALTEWPDATIILICLAMIFIGLLMIKLSKEEAEEENGESDKDP